ncbi:response regulator [Pseudomonas sp. PDM33]|uniref:response regulator n=1 Tax=Pseudomonas sp. PDM33 TaxID=2854765 RepID=UPI001C47860C|nr:response regulator [Pseudomonas sp. PDM33]MBV7586253.1 response regulator [Pseudomonas sp. PDM33]
MSRIVIADPHPYIREALHQRLERSGHEVVGISGDGRESLSLVQRLQPDLVILDLDLPRLGGLELLRRLRAEKPHPKVLVFTSLSGAHYYEASQQGGAAGFVHKDSSPSDVDDAVKMVLSGHKVFPAQLAGTTVEGSTQIEHITPRELTVLQYLAQGYRIKDIADELAINDRTVSTYKTRLLEKTQTSSLIDLVAAAHARGLLSDQQINHLAHEPMHSTAGTNDLEQLLEILPNAVSLWNAKGELLACNRRFAEVHRRGKAELIGQRIFELGMTEPGHIARAKQEFLNGAAGGAPFSLVAAGLLDGETLTYHLIGVPLKDDAGSPIGVMCSYVDVTEQQHYIERLQESKAYLESIFASRAELLLSAGRDLLQELEALDALLSEGRSRHPQETALVEALPRVDRMRDRIEVLLELIQMERGNMLTVPRSEELNRLTRKSLDIAHPDQAFIPEDQEHWAWIDPNRYQRLLRILTQCFDKSGLPQLEVRAESALLPFAEITWQLLFVTTDGTPVQDRLAGIDRQAGWQLARRLCGMLGGELRIGSDSQPEVAALIQLKLPKGNPRI